MNVIFPVKMPPCLTFTSLPSMNPSSPLVPAHLLYAPARETADAPAETLHREGDSDQCATVSAALQEELQVSGESGIMEQAVLSGATGENVRNCSSSNGRLTRVDLKISNFTAGVDMFTAYVSHNGNCRRVDSLSKLCMIDGLAAVSDRWESLSCLSCRTISARHGSTGDDPLCPFVEFRDTDSELHNNAVHSPCEQYEGQMLLLI